MIRIVLDSLKVLIIKTSLPTETSIYIVGGGETMEPGASKAGPKGMCRG